MPSSDPKLDPKSEEANTKPLNDRQRRFLLAFTSATAKSRGNATQSARVAGYTGNTHALEVTGSRLLRDVRIRAEIARLNKLAEDASVSESREVRQIMSRMLRGELRVPLGIHDGEVVYGPPKASDRRGAGEYLAKVRGEMREGRDVVVSGPEGGPVQVALGWSAPVARAELERRVRERYPADKVDEVLSLLLGNDDDDAAKESAA